MKTKIIKINPQAIDFEAIAQAGEILKKGGLVAFPTETVYGLGGDATNPDASHKIFSKCSYSELSPRLAITNESRT